MLDLPLPDASGLDVLQEIREADGIVSRFDPRLPVIVLSGRGSDEERVRGLEFGADDYVVKPYVYGELRARMTAVLRRVEQRRSGPLRVGEIVVDPDRRRAWVEPITLTNVAGFAKKRESPPPKIPPKDELAQVSRQCHGELNGYHILFAMSMSGIFHYKYGHWVWTNEPPDCRKWGPSQPALVHCYIKEENVSNEHLDVIGDFKFPGGIITGSPSAMCYTLDGVLPVRPGEPIPGEPVFHGELHNPHEGVPPGDSCPWGHFAHPLGR